MSRRHTSRKLAMRVLYQTYTGLPLAEAMGNLQDDQEYLPETKEWTVFLVLRIWQDKEHLDNLIKQYSIGWDITRINPLDRCIMQIAFYELEHTDTVANIVINEALEIAKKYSSEEAPKFINGILGHYVKDRKLSLEADQGF